MYSSGPSKATRGLALKLIYVQTDVEFLKSDNNVERSCRALPKLAFRAQQETAPAHQSIAKGGEMRAQSKIMWRRPRYSLTSEPFTTRCCRDLWGRVVICNVRKLEIFRYNSTYVSGAIELLFV